MSTWVLAQAGCIQRGGCSVIRRPSGCTSIRTAETIRYVLSERVENGEGRGVVVAMSFVLFGGSPGQDNFCGKTY